jgi:hypothetical protein
MPKVISEQSVTSNSIPNSTLSYSIIAPSIQHCSEPDSFRTASVERAVGKRDR